METLTKYELILGGIRESLERHTNGRGTCTIAAETFVKNVIQACFVRIVATGETISSRKIDRLGSANKNQVTTCCDNVASLIADDTIVTSLEHKQ
jgi:hypothetical protein